MPALALNRCSVALGDRSPSLSLTNPKGITRADRQRRANRLVFIVGLAFVLEGFMWLSVDVWL
jgi:hypothetical protein